MGKEVGEKEGGRKENSKEIDKQGHPKAHLGMFVPTTPFYILINL